MANFKLTGYNTIGVLCSLKIESKKITDFHKKVIEIVNKYKLKY